MTPEQSIRLGQDAQAFLEDNEALRTVVEEVRAQLMGAFTGDDDDKALEARREAKVLENLLTRLARKAEIGRVTAKKLAESQEQPDEGG